MEKKHARMATFRDWLRGILPLGLILLAPSCLESKPKVLGAKKLDVVAVDTANSDTFRFNFAYRDPNDVATSRTIYLQGIANSNTVMATTCNAAGTGCQCEFMGTDSGGVDFVIPGLASTPSYDSIGNFFSCAYNTSLAPLATLTKVRLRNIAGTKVSAASSVETVITPQSLVGTELDVNKVRTVSRYLCQYNYLEKVGTNTTPVTFNCNSTLSLCGSGAGNGGNFCFVQIKYPFFLFKDNYSTNMFKQMTDQVYNAGGTNVLCNRQAKQYDCTAGTTGQNIAKAFGLYSEQIGNFQVPILLNSAPAQASETYGYAARVGSSGICPPGMVKRTFYEATIAARADTSLAADIARDVSLATITPSALAVNRQYGNGGDPALGLGGTGGGCDGTTCTPPRGPIEALTTHAYVATGSQFCVIDPLILP